MTKETRLVGPEIRIVSSNTVTATNPFNKQEKQESQPTFAVREQYLQLLVFSVASAVHIFGMK